MKINIFKARKKKSTPWEEAITTIQVFPTHDRDLLMKFANFLNTYKGLEDCRFDFMVLDFLKKKK